MSLKSMTSTHEVTVQKKTVTRGGGGGPVNSYASLRKQKCRVIPLPAKEVTDLKKRGLNVDYKVIFHSDPAVDTEHRLLWTDAGGTQRKLHVKGTQNPHALNRFWKILCLEQRDVDNAGP